MPQLPVWERFLSKKEAQHALLATWSQQELEISASGGRKRNEDIVTGFTELDSFRLRASDQIRTLSRISFGDHFHNSR